MIKKLFFASMMLCVIAGGARADDADKPHLFDDLNDDGVSDGAAKAEMTSDSTTPSQETIDEIQPTDDGTESGSE